MLQIVKRFCRSTSGATSIEYALIASLIALAIITMLTAIGGSLSSVFVKIKGNL